MPTYETRPQRIAEIASCQNGSLCCDDIYARHPPGPRWRISLSNERLLDCSGRSWWWGSRSQSCAWLWSNAIPHLSVRRISTGFAFLGREAGMPIADTWLAYSPKNTYLRAFIVGVVNMLRVAAIGIVLATVLGTMIGIARHVVQLCCYPGLPRSMWKSFATFHCCCSCYFGTC